MPMTARELYQKAARYGLRNTFWYMVSVCAVPSRFDQWDETDCRVMEQALAKDFAHARELEAKAKGLQRKEISS